MTERDKLFQFPVWDKDGEMVELNVAPSTGDRRRDSSNTWLDPRFLAQLLAILLGLVGGLIGVYVVSQTRATKLEIAAQSLDAKASRIDAQVSQIAASVQQVANITSRLQAQVDAQQRELDDIKRTSETQSQMMTAWVVATGNKISRLEAKSKIGE